MKRLIFMLTGLLFLTSCSIWQTQGTFIAQNETFNKKLPLSEETRPYLAIPFELKNGKIEIMNFKFLHMFDYGITWNMFIIIPLPTPSINEKISKENNNYDFALSLYNPAQYNQDLVSNLKIMLFVNGKYYNAMKNLTERPRISPTDWKTSLQYTFPLKVKEVDKSAILIFEYNNLKKEVPIVYDQRWIVK